MTAWEFTEGATLSSSDFVEVRIKEVTKNCMAGIETGLTKKVGVLALLLFEIPVKPGSPLVQRTLHLGFLP